MADALTEKIIACAIEVHRILGPGFMESVYEEALVVEFELNRVAHERQVQVEVNYKGRVIKGQRLDLLVENEVIVEVKALAKSPDIAHAQVLSYLKATRLKRALILNFGAKRMVDGVNRISLFPSESNMASQ